MNGSSWKAANGIKEKPGKAKHVQSGKWESTATPPATIVRGNGQWRGVYASQRTDRGRRGGRGRTSFFARRRVYKRKSLMKSKMYPRPDRGVREGGRWVFSSWSVDFTMKTCEAGVIWNARGQPSCHIVHIYNLYASRAHAAKLYSSIFINHHSIGPPPFWKTFLFFWRKIVGEGIPVLRGEFGHLSSSAFPLLPYLRPMLTQSHHIVFHNGKFSPNFFTRLIHAMNKSNSKIDHEFIHYEPDHTLNSKKDY